MGVYLDRLNNLSSNQEPFNLSLNIQEDFFSQVTTQANIKTNGYIGIGVLTALWFMIYVNLSNRENLYELTHFQALISTNTIIFTLGLILIMIEVLTTPQHFVWVAGLTFIVNCIAVLRSG